jgi:hypothetical protein
MLLDASGNLGVGLTSPTAARLVVQGVSGNNALRVNERNGNSALRVDEYGGVYVEQDTLYIKNTLATPSNGTAMLFLQGASEKARINTSGNLLVGITSVSPGAGTASTIISGGDGGVFVTVNSSPVLRAYSLNGGFPDLLQIANNGNVTNANNSYGAISDVKLKENIVDASPKLADLMQVKVRNYNLIGDTTKQIGVVAQELETVFPALVDETTDTDAEGNDLGTTTKSVKYSVFVPMLIKAIQEQQAMIESLRQRLSAANL